MFDGQRLFRKHAYDHFSNVAEMVFDFSVMFQLLCLRFFNGCAIFQWLREFSMVVRFFNGRAIFSWLCEFSIVVRVSNGFEMFRSLCDLR